MRERVGVFEQSSFAKFLVQGATPSRRLNRIATANVDVAVGRCVYTQFLNAGAGHRSGPDASRGSRADCFLSSRPLSRRRTSKRGYGINPRQRHCVVTDVSEALSMLNVQGPARVRCCRALSPDDCSNAAFPFGTCREVHIGYQSALAIRLTYVGELGWELYIPSRLPSRSTTH